MFFVGIHYYLVCNGYRMIKEGCLRPSAVSIYF